MKDQKKQSVRMITFAVLTILSAFIVMRLIVGHMKIGRSEPLPLTQYTAESVIDGIRAPAPDPGSIVLSNGDKVIYHISLPSKNVDTHSSPRFLQYNCEETVSFEGRTLYEKKITPASGGENIGNIYTAIPVPDDAWGKEITVELTFREKAKSTRVMEFMLLNTTFPNHCTIRQTF